MWSPEGNPAVAAPPGVCHFRKQIALPIGRKLLSAQFLGTADNHFRLFINGSDAGQSDTGSEGWRNPVQLDVKSHLKEGVNLLAIRAVNASDRPNPAGLLGCLQVDFDSGEPLLVPVDSTWKVSHETIDGWTDASFNDVVWRLAAEVAPYGGAPWSAVGIGPLTLSPAKADPFSGTCDLPANVDLRQGAVLVMEGLAPEAAARVTINGSDAGGLIGFPLHLQVGKYLKPGVNRIRIEPFAPTSARLVMARP